MKCGKLGLVTVLVYVFTPGSFAGTIFTFGSGESHTPFTLTADGLEASFTSNGDPGGFEVGFFPVLNPTGLSLVECNPCALSLTVDFSAPQTSIAMFFGTFLQTGAPSVPFNLTAFNGASQVGAATATGVVPPGLPLAFGDISFSGPAFNSVVLSAPTADSFWILAGIAVRDASTVPEPGSMSTLAFVGFCGLAITRLRRRGASGAWFGPSRNSPSNRQILLATGESGPPKLRSRL
jgi:hypothetical protein